MYSKYYVYWLILSFFQNLFPQLTLVTILGCLIFRFCYLRIVFVNGLCFFQSNTRNNKTNSDTNSGHKQSKQSDNDWGWGNDNMSTYESDSAGTNKQIKGALKLGGPKKPPSDDFGWIEEEFAPIEDSSVKPASSYDWGHSGGNTTGGEDFFSLIDSGPKVGEISF